ncbi:Endocuticle structural glycoprotein SgAbd-2 [Orchesella cincta]|uniref:Endocuticle structural glycoprotein SgAbd-2 n=1 Tax=Orchesella cincta TaxID=48709 RepID=A0A1D2N3L2_ORCCI|nr:Endocuticle structural glycoprotein SgAbd-2 [Orchesella cincta]
MKIVAIVFLLLKFGNVARGQYGIPDDDDDLPAATFVRTPTPLVFTTRAPELQLSSYQKELRSLPTTSNTHVEIRQEKATYSAPVAVRTVARAPVEVQSTRYEIRDDSAQYEAPVVRDSLPSYASTPAKTSVRINPETVIKQDTYSSPKTYATSVKAEVVPIVKYVMEQNSHGTFRLETVSGDGTTYNKEGQLKDLGSKEGPVQVMQGSYSFNGDDGKVYKVDWTADEGGFRATGDHLPSSV